VVLPPGVRKGLVTLHDLAGRLVLQQALSTGNTNMPIANTIRPGTYTVRLIDQQQNAWYAKWIKG